MTDKIRRPVLGLLTVADLAANTGLPVTTIRWHCRQGLLAGAAIAVPGRWLIPQAAADRFQRDYVRRGRLA